MEAKIEQMLSKIAKGDFSGFKSKIGDIPKEALSFISGLSIEEGILIKMEALNLQE